MAALLWGGADAVLSHRSAAALLDLDGVAPEGIPTLGPLCHTDPSTTLLDLASALDDDRWEWALESARRVARRPRSG
jgi:hypothetical protein